MMFLAFIGLVQMIQEDGYLYSVHSRKFLTYKPSAKESRVFLARRGIRPMRFRISELQGSYSGAVRITPLNRDKKDLVLDRSGYDASLIQYAEHGGDNQVWRLSMVPGMMVKLSVTDQCIEAKTNDFYLTATSCDHYEKAPGQYFRWIPSTIERIVSNAVQQQRRPQPNPHPSSQAVDPNEIGLDHLPLSDFSFQYRPRNDAEAGCNDWVPPGEYPRRGRVHGRPSDGYWNDRLSKRHSPGDGGSWSDDYDGAHCDRYQYSDGKCPIYGLGDDELMQKLLNFDRSLSGNLFSA